MPEDTIIDVQHVWKRYGLPPLLPWKKRQLSEEDYALKDISFQIPRGGSLGILGRNGAGKSTLLKLLAGVTPPDKGKIDIQGSIFPMIELNAGISKELTGRENIRLLATVMGFNYKAIPALEEDVVDFAELDHWIDKPVWQYSSGMKARLAFGIAVNAKADILLVDEILSVGDIYFQKKSKERIIHVLKKGTTLIYVSQNAFDIERLCNEAMILQKGYLDFLGSSTEARIRYISTSYNKKSVSIKNNQISFVREVEKTGEIYIKSIKIISDHNFKTNNLCLLGEVSIIIECVLEKDINHISIAIRIQTLEGKIVASLSPKQLRKEDTLKSGNLIFRCHIPRWILYGEPYQLSIKLNTLVLSDMVITDSLPQTVIPKEIPNLGNAGVAYLDSEWDLKNGN